MPPRRFGVGLRALTLVRLAAGRTAFRARVLADLVGVGRLPFRLTALERLALVVVRAFLETALRPDELFRPPALRAGFLAIVRTLLGTPLGAVWPRLTERL